MTTQRTLSDWQRCADGTSFVVHSEHVRGEPRYYWVERHHPDDEPSKQVSSTGSFNRTTAQRRARRLAEDYDLELRSDDRDKK